MIGGIGNVPAHSHVSEKLSEAMCQSLGRHTSQHRSIPRPQLVVPSAIADYMLLATIWYTLSKIDASTRCAAGCLDAVTGERGPCTYQQVKWSVLVVSTDTKSRYRIETHCICDVSRDRRSAAHVDKQQLQTRRTDYNRTLPNKNNPNTATNNAIATQKPRKANIHADAATCQILHCPLVTVRGHAS